MKFSFEDFVLDVDRRELRRGAALVPVEPQAFDLLLFLIKNRHRVVTKDDLIEAVWGGRIVSESALTTRINATRVAIGDSGKDQRLIRTLPRKGIRFIGELREEPPEGVRPDPASQPPPVLTVPTSGPSSRQEVRFCKTADGVNLAVATCGEGLPLVKTGTWLTHIEHDWQSPIWSPLLVRLAAQFRLVRYDPRGCGLSDRTVVEISFEAFVRDLEAVVDALGFKRVALLGISQGAAVSIAYAVRHPKRVSHLVLSGGYPLGWRGRGSEAEIALRDAMLPLIKHGWGRDNPAFRQVFSSRLFPDGTPEEMQWLNELQRISTSPENAVEVQRSIGDIDVLELLPRVQAPTLVLHSSGDLVHPLEMGLMLARGIPNARFVELDSRNHVPLSHEAAWSRYVDEISAFLTERHELPIVLRGDARASCALIGEDDGAARSALNAAREYVIANLEGRGARIVATPADTIIAAFTNAATGVAAAVDARNELAALNRDLPSESRVYYRFGIASGDCFEGNEGPGGQGVERAGALGLDAHPDAVRLSNDVKAALPPDPCFATKAGAGGHELIEGSDAVPGIPAQLLSLDLRLPDRPSIVLLPFMVLGDNPDESGAFAEGLRIDIQNALTKMSGVFLLGAGSANAMRGWPAKEAAARTGVRYVLEGAVQRSGEQVRVNVQLTDAAAGAVLWSDRYECVLDHDFRLQDEITRRVVTALDVRLASGEQARVWRKCLTDPKALECFYRGVQAFFRMNAEAMATARACFARVAELAPASPLGATWVALCLWFESTRGWAADPAHAREQAGVWAERAVAMGDADGQAHTVLGNVRLLQRRFDEALAIAHEALVIRPGCTNANGFLANVLLYCGEPHRATTHAKRAIRYMPVYPPWFVEILAAAYRDAGALDLAIVAAREVPRIAPPATQGRLVLASALVRSGWLAEARRVAREVLVLDPKLTLEKWASSQPYRASNVLAGITHDLHTAGIPE